MGVTLRAHPVHGESHTQRNASGEVATQTTLPGHKRRRVSCMQRTPSHQVALLQKTQEIGIVLCQA